MKTVNLYHNETMRWTASDGTNYLVHVLTDDFPDNPRKAWDTPLTTMACWHSRYALGDDIGNAPPEDFWRELVRSNVPELEIVEAVEAGKLPGIRLVQKEGGFVDIYETTFLATPLGNSPAIEGLEYEGVPREAAAQYIMDDLTITHCMTLMEPYAEWMPLWLYDHSGITMSCGSRTGQFADRWDSGQVGWIIMMKDKVMTEFPVSENDWRSKAIEVMEADVELYDQYLTGEVYCRTLYTKEDNEWVESDSSSGFFGSDIVKSGLIEDLPGAKNALEADKCVFGDAKVVTTTSYVFD